MAQINVIYASKISFERGWNILKIGEWSGNRKFTVAYKSCGNGTESQGFELCVKMNENPNENYFYFTSYMTVYNDETLEQKINEKCNLVEKLIGEKTVEESMLSGLKEKLDEKDSLFGYAGIIQYFGVDKPNHVFYNQYIDFLQLKSEERLKKEQEEKEKLIKKEELEKQKHKQFIDHFVVKVKHGEEIEAEYFTILLKHFGIWKTIPIKTRGWLNSSLKTVTENGYKFVGKNPAQKVCYYYKLLQQQINV